MQEKTFRIPYSILSPTGCLIAFLGFFLTFTEINCNGKTLDTITGIELATGYQQDIDIVQSDDQSTEKQKPERYDPNIFALNGILAAIIGLVLFLIPAMRKQYALHAIVAGIGFVSMIGLMINLKSELAKARSGDSGIVNINLDLSFDMQPGYWLVTAAFLVTLVVDVVMWRGSKTEVTSTTDSNT